MQLLHGELGSPQAALAVRGPARFYYDKATYTGVHRNGGPSTLGSAKWSRDLRGGGGKEFVSHGSLRVGRPQTDLYAAAAAPVRGGSRSPSPPRPCSSRGGTNAAAAHAHCGRSSLKNSIRRPSSGCAFYGSAATSASSSPRSETGYAASAGRPQRASLGPERFFYDKSTYTGVHKHGGPSTVDRDTVVADISEITRTHLKNGSTRLVVPRATGEITRTPLMVSPIDPCEVVGWSDEPVSFCGGFLDEAVFGRGQRAVPLSPGRAGRADDWDTKALPLSPGRAGQAQCRSSETDCTRRARIRLAA